MKPTVTIICIAYNQEKYISRAIDSFLIQKTNFDVEVLIHDDASTDKTSDILRGYQKKYPQKIKLTIQKENQYSKKDWIFINNLFVNARGKYIAMCEGDDYWTDENKLQKQVDYMEAHPECALVFHPVKVVFQNSEEKSYTIPNMSKAIKFTPEELIRENFISTSAVMYRAKHDYEKLERKIMPQDLYLHLYHAVGGSMHCINEIMSVYRRQSGGVWWGSYGNMDSIYLSYRTMLVSFYESIIRMYPNNQAMLQTVRNHEQHLLNSFLDIDKNKGAGLIEETARQFPELVSAMMQKTKLMLEEQDSERKRLTKDLETALKEISRLETAVVEKDDLINKSISKRMKRVVTRLKH